MYSRKLHVDGEDPQRLYRALRQLYSDGVRIPFGKPYTARKNARRVTLLPPQDNDFSRECEGLSLAEEKQDNSSNIFLYNKNT